MSKTRSHIHPVEKSNSAYLVTRFGTNHYRQGWITYDNRRLMKYGRPNGLAVTRVEQQPRHNRIQMIGLGYDLSHSNSDLSALSCPALAWWFGHSQRDATVAQVQNKLNVKVITRVSTHLFRLRATQLNSNQCSRLG